jgi:hypothetical protein
MSLAVQVRNLQAGQRSNIKCRFSYLGTVTTVPANISSQSLTCQSVKVHFFFFCDSEISNIACFCSNVANRNPIPSPSSPSLPISQGTFSSSSVILKSTFLLLECC